MDAIPDEWIDKIFDMFNNWFNDKWKKMISEREVLYRTIWKNGLKGLSKEEIREGLKCCKKMASFNQGPPHVLEFFDYCKKIRHPYFLKNNSSHLTSENATIGKKWIKTIRENYIYRR